MSGIKTGPPLYPVVPVSRSLPLHYVGSAVVLFGADDLPVGNPVRARSLISSGTRDFTGSLSVQSCA